MKNQLKKIVYLERHLEAIEKNGLQSIELEELLKLLEISRGSFYNYFKTKTDYLIDLVIYIKEKSFEDTNLLVRERGIENIDFFINQLVLKYSVEETYDIEKMKLFLAMQQQREPAFNSKLNELNAIDLNWIARRFQEIFGLEAIYCREAAILFLNMVYELLTINKNATIKSPLQHLLRETVQYAQLIASYNASNQQTLFFENQQALEAQLKWEQLRQIMNQNMEKVTPANLELAAALIEELNRRHVRGDVVKAFIHAFNQENESLKNQLVAVL